MKEGKSVKLNHQQQHQNGHHSPSKFSKLLDPEASWDKDQLGDVLHWIRQVLGLVCGLLWGAIPLVGGIWFILFLVLSTAIIYGYCTLVLKVDEEEFGGHGALLQEGLFASITLFVFSTLLIGLALEVLHMCPTWIRDLIDIFTACRCLETMRKFFELQLFALLICKMF